MRERLRIVAAARQRIAANPDALAASITSLPRTPADTLGAEVLPLLSAMRFLEQQAERILKPRRLATRSLPIWLLGTRSEVTRAPFGAVLIIGPSNYPLLLAGVQTVQALVAGNTVVWKPGRGGQAVAERFAEAMYASGLPRETLRITDESIAAVETELARGVDKVFFTGSVAVGRILMERLAKNLTPSVMELSGNDAVIVLPSADLSYVAKALAFGMRLNGSATCMAPRRILLVSANPQRRQQLIDATRQAFSAIDGIHLPEPVKLQLDALLQDAQQSGATVHGIAAEASFRPLLVVDGQPSMKIAQADLFAPVVTLIDVEGEAGILAAQTACPFGLTASIFGDEQAARSLAAKLDVGSVLINDMFVATADPRVPFGGQRQSGFGTTRGAEGLLEMTLARTIAVRRGSGSGRFDPTGEPHERLFRNLIHALYAKGLRSRVRAIRELVRAGRHMPLP